VSEGVSVTLGAGGARGAVAAVKATAPGAVVAGTPHPLAGPDGQQCGGGGWLPQQAQHALPQHSRRPVPSMSNMLERGLVSRILFPVPRPSYTVDSFPRELIWVPKHWEDRESTDVSAAPSLDEESVPCLLLTYPSARFLIIFFHSNAEDLGRCRGFCCYLREQFQVHVLAVEYPGYGICPGLPSGETVMENALAALHFVRNTLDWPLDSIKVFGRSIGTGPAVGLASLFSFAGVILVTPFLSIQELFRDRIGPFAGLVEEYFANETRALKITSPTMIIHGQRDELISCRHGESLYDLLRSRKLLVSPPEMEHNTNLLTNLHFFVLPMFHFFALPDYVFQDMIVPAWAYDKRRSPFHCPGGGPLVPDAKAIPPLQCLQDPSPTKLSLSPDDRVPQPPPLPRCAASTRQAVPESMSCASTSASSSATSSSAPVEALQKPGTRGPLALSPEVEAYIRQCRTVPSLITCGPRPPPVVPLCSLERGETDDGSCPVGVTMVQLGGRVLAPVPKPADSPLELSDHEADDHEAEMEKKDAAEENTKENDDEEENDESAKGTEAQAAPVSIAKESGAVARSTAAQLLQPVPQEDITPKTPSDLETEDAIRRLEDFAGKLCTAEICSDRLCELEDQSDGEGFEEVSPHQKKLGQILRARQAVGLLRRESPYTAATVPTSLLLGTGNPGAGICGHASRPVHVEWEPTAPEFGSDSPTMQAPRLRRLDVRASRGASGGRSKVDFPPQGRPHGPGRTERGGKGLTSVWSRWCGTGRLMATVDVEEVSDDVENVRSLWAWQMANGRGGSHPAPAITPGRWQRSSKPLGQMKPTGLGTWCRMAEASPQPHLLSACCRAVPSDHPSSDCPPRAKSVPSCYYNATMTSPTDEELLTQVDGRVMALPRGARCAVSI